MGGKSAELTALRTKLLGAQLGRCGICGYRIDHHLDVTRDHVIPLSARGANILGNFLASHFLCNNRKTDDMPTGCQILLLIAVNARLEVEPTLPGPVLLQVRPARREYLVLA